MKIFRIFKNRIIKDTISILFIFLFFFGNIAPSTINAYSNIIENENNYSQKIYPQDEFSFHFSSKYGSGEVKIEMDKIESAQFYPIEFPSKDYPQFLIGIVEVTNDNDPVSKEIGKDVFLGMRQDEIINEIKNKYKSRIWNYNGKNVYNYSIENQNIIVNLDSMIINREAKGGIAVILEVENLPMMNNTPIINNEFKLRSICINDNSEDLGIIYINDKYYSLPNSVELLKNKRYFINYIPSEGYEFDHWEITGGKLAYKNNESNNILIIQNDYGEIIAFYRKIGVATTITTSSTSILTTSTSTTSLRTTTTSSSSTRITTTTQTSTLRTTSIGTTSTRTEIKTTSSTLTTSSIKKEENFIDSYIVTPIKEYIINPIIKYIIEPINEYIIKPFTKYIIEPILKYIIQPFIEYIIKPIIEIIIKIIEIIKNIIKIILDILGWIINTIIGQNKETYTTSQSFTSYSTKYKTYEKTKSIEEKSTYKEYSISYEKTKYDSTKFIISYETKINTIYITKTIKTIGNKEIITTYPIITTIYENPSITTTTSNTITSYKTSSPSSISTTIPKKITTIYEKTSTIKNTEEPITTYKQITTTITSSSLTSSTSTKSEIPKQTSTIKTTTSSKLSSTSYKTTSSSNIIYTTTISKYTTKTTYPLKTETIYVTITGFTTTYKTPIYTYTTIVTTKKTSTTSSSQNYGGGGGRREGPLLRDSILSHPIIYKEFLKKKEENRKLPLLYLVYKVTPLKVEQYENYYNKMKVYKVNVGLKNYDNKERKCILSIGRIDKWPLGFFLSKPNVPYSGYPLNSILENEKYSKEIKIENKIEINLKANEKENEEYQIFFEEDIDSPYLFLYVFHNDLTLIDMEPNFNEMVYTSLFWSGFWDAMKDRAPGIIVSTGLILAISLTGGTAQTALVATAFLLKARSTISEAENIYEACENINSLMDITNIYEDIANIARGKGYNAVAEYLKDEADATRGKILEVAMGLGLDLLLNVNYNNLKIALGIEKARNEYEKGYATGDVVASIINVASYVAVAASIKKLDENLGNKISLWSAVKDSLKEWLSPNIMDFTVMIKGSVKNVASIGKTYSSKVENILEGIAAAGLLSSKSEKTQYRLKADLEPLIKDLTEDKITKDLSLLDPVGKKTYQFYSLANEIIEIAGKREGEYNKDLLKGLSGELFKLAGDIYGKTGSIEFTKDTFEALDNIPKEVGVPDPVKIAKDYLSNDKNLEIFERGWKILKGGEDYKRLFKGFIGWETSLGSYGSYEKRLKLNNILNDYIDSGKQSKVLLLSNTFDWTYELRKSITSSKMRVTLLDHMTEFLDYWNLEYIKSLDDTTLGKINSIINNFRNVYNLRDVNDVKLVYTRFLHLNDLLHKYTLVGKEGNIVGIDWNLFNDWINKALKVSCNKNDFLTFMKEEKSVGWYHTYIDTEVAGKNTAFFGLKVPIKIRESELNGYVPLIKSSEGMTRVPVEVAEFLKSIKYIPGEEGFLIISTDTGNGKIFAPVMVESEYRVSFLMWTKKALSLSQQYSKYVKLEEGVLNVDWKKLIEERAVLIVTIVKLDETIVTTRYVFFKPDLLTIRIGLGSDNCKNKGVAPHSTVIVIFDFVKMENIKDYEAIEKISRAYGSVMGLRECDVTSDPEKGLLGEYRICQIILENTPKGTIIDVRIDDGKIDIETTKHLIEVKYWEDETTKYEKDIKELIKELKEYYIKYNEEKYENGKKIVLTFYKQLSDEALNRVKEALKNAFNGNISWLTICNGNYNFENFIRNEYPQD